MKDVTNALAPPPVPEPQVKTAREAADAARGGAPNVPPVDIEEVMPMTTGVVKPQTAAASEPSPQGAAPDLPPARPHAAPAAANPAQATSRPGGETSAQTQYVRGKQKLERSDFSEDPVVGWLVVVGGPGLGSFRPLFEGNNTVGRSRANRVPIDFGDEAISKDEQAYIRYDSTDRSFLLVPNMSKTNVIALNNDRPAQPVRLSPMDLITMGRTQLVFVPFCGADFDWGELSELNRT